MAQSKPIVKTSEAVLDYLRSHPNPPPIKNAVDVVNTVCRVVENINETTKNKNAKMSGPAKKVLAVQLVNTVASQLSTHGYMTYENYIQAQPMLQDTLFISGLIDSVVAIWNEFTKRKWASCSLFQCCKTRGK